MLSSLEIDKIKEAVLLAKDNIEEARKTLSALTPQALNENDALSVAIQSDDTGAVELVIDLLLRDKQEFFAAATTPNRYGETPVHIACKHPRMLQLILEKSDGKSLLDRIMLQEISLKPQQAMFLLSLLAQYSSPEQMTMILNTASSNEILFALSNQTPPYNETPLMIAAATNPKTLLAILQWMNVHCSDRAVYENIVYMKGGKYVQDATLLHYLMERHGNGYDEACLNKILEALGNDVISKIIKFDDRYLWPVMNLAAEFHPSHLPALMEPLTRDCAERVLLSTDYRGYTRLHQVAANQTISAEDKKTSFMWFVSTLGEKEVCKVILNVDGQSEKSNAPMHTDMRRGDLGKIAAELNGLDVKTALDRLNQPNIFGMTPIHFAAVYCPDFFQFISAFLANKNASAEDRARLNQILIQPNILGDAPLHLAARGTPEAMIAMIAMIKISSMIEDKKILATMISTRNAFNATPLDLALRSNPRVLISILSYIPNIQAVTDTITTANTTGYSALQTIAMMQGEGEVVRSLLTFLGDAAAQAATIPSYRGNAMLHMTARSDPGALLKIMQQLDSQAEMRTFYNNAAAIKLLCEIFCIPQNSEFILQFIELLSKNLNSEIIKVVKDTVSKQGVDLLSLAINSPDVRDVNTVLNLFTPDEAINLATVPHDGNPASTPYMQHEAPNYAAMLQWFADHNISITSITKQFAQDEDRLKALCQSICDIDTIKGVTADAVRFVVGHLLALHKDIGDCVGVAMLNALRDNGFNLLCLIAQYCPELDVRTVLDCFSPEAALALVAHRDPQKVFPASIMAERCFGNLMNMIDWFSVKGINIIAQIASDDNYLRSFCEAVSRNEGAAPKFILQLAIQVFKQLGAKGIAVMQNAFFGHPLNLQDLFKQCREKEIAAGILPIAVQIGDQGAINDILLLLRNSDDLAAVKILVTTRDQPGNMTILDIAARPPACTVLFAMINWFNERDAKKEINILSKDTYVALQQTFVAKHGEVRLNLLRLAIEQHELGIARQILSFDWSADEVKRMMAPDGREGYTPVHLAASSGIAIYMLDWISKKVDRAAFENIMFCKSTVQFSGTKTIEGKTAPELILDAMARRHTSSCASAAGREMVGAGEIPHDDAENGLQRLIEMGGERIVELLFQNKSYSCLRDHLQRSMLSAATVFCRKLIQGNAIELHQRDFCLHNVAIFAQALLITMREDSRYVGSQQRITFLHSIVENVRARSDQDLVSALFQNSERVEKSGPGFFSRRLGPREAFIKLIDKQIGVLVHEQSQEASRSEKDSGAEL